MFLVQFRRGGLKRDSIKQFARIGTYKGYNATLQSVTKIRRDFDSAAVKSKVQTQEQIQNVQKRSTVGVKNQNDVPIAIAATIPNVEDEINDPSSNADTIPLTNNMDNTLPYGADDWWWW